MNFYISQRKKSGFPLESFLNDYSVLLTCPQRCKDVIITLIRNLLPTKAGYC